MTRRFLAVLLIALALATLGLYARAVMSPLTLSIGSSASIALVQKAAAVEHRSAVSLAAAGSSSLPVPSTAGTFLLLIVANADITGGVPSSISGLTTGWVQLFTATEPTGSKIEAWGFPANPGGIQVVQFTLPAVVGQSYLFEGHLSEWSNVATGTVLQASGAASATSGTTLSPVTTSSVLSVGDLAIAAWFQGIAAPATPTFTTPSGWTKLIDNGATSLAVHSDIEYLLSPATGTTLSVTLTSTSTTATASGFVIALKASPPVTDQTAMLAY